jgi:hypothetical protein
VIEIILLWFYSGVSINIGHRDIDDKVLLKYILHIGDQIDNIAIY